MIVLIVDNYAHRLLQNGLVESAPVREINEPEGTGFYVTTETWMPVDPVVLHLTGGDAEYIRQTLKRLNDLFPSGRPDLPKATMAQVTGEGGETPR